MDEPVSNKTISSASFTRRHFELIGKIITHWSTLEFACASLACTLARMRGPEALLIVLRLPFLAQLEVLRLYTNSMPLDRNLRQELESLFTCIKQMHQKRNILAHGIVDVNHYAFRLIKHDLRGGHVKIRHFNREELDRLALDAKDLISRIFELREKVASCFESKSLELALLDQAREET